MNLASNMGNIVAVFKESMFASKFEEVGTGGWVKNTKYRVKKLESVGKIGAVGRKTYLTT